MEFIMISDSKLKIALTPADMKEYSLDCETIDYDKTETRAAFWQFFDDVKLRTGFDAASDRIFVQIYSSVGGGCEMYVTKLEDKSESGIQETDSVSAEGLPSEMKDTQKISDRPCTAVNSGEADCVCAEHVLSCEKNCGVSDPSTENGTVTARTERYIYRTESMGELLGLCGYLGSRNDIASSSAYRDPSNGRYYLMLGTYEDGGGLIPLSAYLDEYGVHCPSGAAMYITEHMDCICSGNAVGTLAGLL